MWTSVRGHPWRGENYERPAIFPHRILILGESNYADANKFCSDLVISCVLDDIGNSADRDTQGFCKFSTKIRRVIFGRDTKIGPVGFWENVAFYNFVQYLVGGKSKIRPTPKMWIDSVEPFFEVVTTLKPESILVLGKGNWNNLLSHLKPEIIDETKANITVADYTVLAGYIFHPSSGRGFSYQRWQPVAKNVVLK